jgi:hypothetical protein
MFQDSMLFRSLSHRTLASALIAGLALRLYFVFHFPFYAGDTKFYEELARNWLYHGVYGLFVQGQLLPVDMRMPGYPAMLAAIYATVGKTRMAVMIVQVVIDLLTCLLTAVIAARLAPPSQRRRVATGALWLAALCPFTANYTAAILTETLAIFLTALAILVVVMALENSPARFSAGPTGGKELLHFTGCWLVAGLVAGVGTLVRPETPILLAAVGLLLVFQWRRPADWPKLVLAGLWMAVGLLAALTPWATRNARTLGRIEFLAPRYAESRGDFVPWGFLGWTRTWSVSFREAYLVPWRLGKQNIPIGTLPSYAFDSDSERARVEKLLDQYNNGLKMTPPLDHEFANLARERTARHPMRTYVLIPAHRAWNLWFTPRTVLLPISGELWPLGESWHSSPTNFVVTWGLGILNFIYFGMAVAGAWRVRALPATVFLVIFVAIRTAFLTQLPTVEARYVMECFPAILALGAQIFAKRRALDGLVFVAAEK